MDASKGGKHDWERFFTTVDGNPRQFHTLFSLLFSRLVQPLHTVKGAETRNLISVLLAVEKQHQRVHPIVFTPGQVLRPPQTFLGNPWLRPVLADGLDTLDHHFRKKVKSLVFCGRAIVVIFLVTGHTCQLLGLYGGLTYADISAILQERFSLSL